MKKIIFGILTIFVFIFGLCTVNKSFAYPVTGPHWTKSPINVYIPNDVKATSMKHAFLKWQNSSYGKLKFNFVQKGPADIDVVFVEKVSGFDGPIGEYKITIKNGFINKAEIKIATKNKNNYSNNLVYTTMLHEIGHALGLPDYERKRTSIMHMPINESQDILKLDIMNLYKLNNWTWMDRNLSH